MLAFGRVGEEFERRFAEFIGVRHVVAVSNGTVALYLGFKALGVGPGDEVVVPDFTFVATASAAMLLGATPVLVDIDPETYTVDPAEVERAVSERTKVVIPVHLYGHPADLDPIIKLGAERGFYIVEDCAQAIGAEYRGRRVGSFGTVAAFSFYPTKNMTTGEGGAVATNDDVVADTVKLLRNHGQRYRYYHIALGWNFRMTDIQAALGLSQLRKLSYMNERRRELARVYREELGSVPQLRLPEERPWARHVYDLYTVWVEREGTRDRLANYLRERGVETAVHYPIPLHQQPILSRARRTPGCCRNSEEASKHVLSLPLHPGLSVEDVLYVSKLVKSFFSS
jgi:perosamine synthetase